MAPSISEYVVTLRFQYPAWDEKDGIEFHDIHAPTKRDAIKRARVQAERDGHWPWVGKGRATFSAKEAE